MKKAIQKTNGFIKYFHFLQCTFFSVWVGPENKHSALKFVTGVQNVNNDASVYGNVSFKHLYLINKLSYLKLFFFHGT